MTLDQLRCGEEGSVVAVTGTGPFRRRLMELGFVPGAPVLRVGTAPLGDPLSVRIRGALVGLRRVDAARIEVASP